MFGFYNIVLRVNLSQQSFELKMLSDQVLCTTLGGKGLAAYLLRGSKPRPASTPISEDSIIFATGPLTGNRVPGSRCCGLFTRSSGENGCAGSYLLGSIAECIAGTGFDAVEVNGASNRPVWIEICEGGSFYVPGSELQGLTGVQTAKQIGKWMRENRPAARKFGIVYIGDGEGKASESPIPEIDWAIDRKSDMARILLAKNVMAFVFWGEKERVLAHPGLIKRFAAKARPFVGTDDRYPQSKTERGVHEKRAKSEPQMEYRSTISDCLIVRDSYQRLYGWEDLELLIKSATGLELGKEELCSIARSIMENIES